jgi:hypothetical protein
MSLLQEEETARQGWSKMPECPYLIVDETGKLYCSFNYENKVSKLRNSLPQTFANDIGVDCGDREAFYEGEITDPCAPDTCPNRRFRID